MIICRSAGEIEKMRAPNQLVANILARLSAAVAPGVTTADLDAMAERRAPSRHSRATAGFPQRSACR